MSKKVQAIIGGAVGLLLLGGAIAALIFWPEAEPIEEEVTPTSTTESIKLVEGVVGELE